MASGPVLLVEDDPFHQRIFAEALERAGYAVAVSAFGEDAPRLCDVHGPRLVILDIKLPGIDGIEACRRIRRQYSTGVPILFVTGSDTLETMREGIEAGGDDFMVKGARLQTYLERVGYWLTRGRLSPHERAAILAKVAGPGRTAPETPAEPPKAARPRPAAADSGATPAAALPTIDRRADPALVAEMAGFVARARAGAPAEFGTRPSEKFALLGYAAGVVNALANSNLEVKMRFVPYLRALLIETMLLSPAEIESSVGRWYTMYRIPAFAAACAKGEEDYGRRLQGAADAAPTPIASLLPDA
jgi:CheY-like chemotaxis protein